jgi:BolA protein
MERKKRIEKKLSNIFKSWTIEVNDISYLHKNHNDFTGENETHFSILLKSNRKDKLNRLEMHRKINDILSKEFLNGLHALEIKIIN